MMLATMSAFERLWALGYERLVPIIPPDAEISETSSLFGRVGTHQDARGKTPGTRRRDTGKWIGFDWVPYEADAHDLTRWAAMGAGVGIKTGQGLYAIDADTLDEPSAKIIRDAVRAHFGETPIRVGRYPKALYLIRLETDIPYMRIEFGLPDARGNKERVEILGDKRQFVADGVHPKTRKPYEWPRPLTPMADMRIHSAGAVEAFLSDLRRSLPDVGRTVAEGGGEDIDQATLRGDPAKIRKAVQSTPNTSRHFAAREDYLAMGYAIKAAVEDEHEAFEIWEEWCERWADGTNDPDIMAADWRRMKPPYRRGAHWIFAKAEETSAGAFTQAMAAFEPIEAKPASPFDIQAEREAETSCFGALDFAPWGERDLVNIPYPEFVYSDFYARGYTSVTLAPPKVGKTMLGLAEAVDMATGRGILTGEQRAPLRVVYYNAEDDQHVIDSRVAALLMEYGISQAEIADTLFPVSGVTRDDFFMVAGADPVINEPLFAALEQFILRERADVLIFDPLQDLSRSPETNDVFRRLGQRLRRMASVCGVALGLIHHTRKLTPGVAPSIDDGRGGSALRGTARFNRLLIGMSEDEAMKAGVGNHRRFLRIGDMESNLAPPSAAVNRWFEKASVTIPNGKAVGVVRPWHWPTAGESISPADVGRVQKAIASASEPYRADARSPRWVGIQVAATLAMDLSQKPVRERVKQLISEWISADILRMSEYHDTRAGRYVATVVCGNRPSDAASVFD